MRNIEIRNYKNEEYSDNSVTAKTFSEAREMVMANQYLSGVIHKLFNNVKSSQIFNLAGVENLDNSFSNLNYENRSSRRDIDLDISQLYEDGNIRNSIEIIGNVPSTFGTSFLALELLLIKKLISENTNVELSDYAKRLKKLTENLFNKDINQIKIDSNVISDLIIQQEQQFKLIGNNHKDINKLQTQLDNELIERDRINNKIIAIKELIHKKEKNMLSLSDDIKLLEKEKQENLKNSLTVIDKIKIRIFEKIGVSDIYDVVIKQKEKKPSFQLNLIEEKLNKKKYDLGGLSEDKEKSLAEINYFKEKFQQSLDKTSLLEGTLVKLEETKYELRSDILNSSEIKDLSIYANKTISKIASDNVFSIHVFPDIQVTETSPLKNELNVNDKIKAIRAFNPSLSTSTYVLDGIPFDNNTFGNGLRGVILGKGNISLATIGDAGTLINENGKRVGYQITDLDSGIDLLKERSNRNSGYNEVVVNNAVPYAEILQIDQFINNLAQNSTQEKKEVKTSLRDWVSLVDNILDSGEKAKMKDGLEPLPLVLMINGKLLQVSSFKEFYKKEDREKISKDDNVNIENLEAFVRENLVIEEIKKLSEITKVSEHMDSTVRKNIAQELIKNYKANVANHIEESLEKKHLIKMEKI